MPRVTRVDGFNAAYDHAEQLRAALDEIAAGDDSFGTLDQRDAALIALWRLGATSKALVTFTGMSSTAVDKVVRGRRLIGQRHDTRVTTLLLTLSEIS